jgi:tRNA U34 5-carboxymethylaminomethyl modifying GTPase MnmE/TrmE
MHEGPRPAEEPRPAIARLLTPPGEGGIAVVSVEGRGAAAAVDRLFSGRASGVAQGAIAYGWLIEDGRRLDEALVWRAGGAIEIGLHGGAAAARAVMRALRRAGARGSAPVPGGSIESEAAALLPRAATLPAAMFLAAAASGALTREIASRDAAGLRALLARYPAGRAFAHPRLAVLAGPPNSGKSTLLNALARRDRALVHPEAGTTRDPVEAVCDFEGYPVRVADAAGFAPARLEADREAQLRARALLDAADVVLWLEDPAAPCGPPGRADVRLSGKCDLGRSLPGAIRVSGATGEGLDGLRAAVLAALGLPRPATAEAAPFEEEHARAIERRLGQ